MSNVTQETLAAMKAALGQGFTADGSLSKAVSTATNLTTYDLQAPAKNLYPILTPLRNSLPRVSRAGHAGLATNWKQITSLTGSGFDAMGWVPEGQRSGVMNYTATNKAASYVTLGEEDSLTFEAEAAAQGFEDVNATVTMRLLQKMMRKEEMAVLGGNMSMALGTPSAIVSSVAAAGATLPAGTYGSYVVALTFEGYKNSSVAGGVSTTKTITGADGQTFTLAGGSSNKSAQNSRAVTLGQSLTLSTPIVNGAVAYAWFVGISGSEILQAITFVNQLVITAPLLTGTQSITAITADNSFNTNYAFDGLMTQAYNSGLSYVQALGTSTAPATLTASGKGSVVEIDTMLQSFWDNYKVGPTAIYVSSQELNNITTKVLSNASAPLLRMDKPASGDEYSVTAGGRIAFYFNPFIGNKIPVIVHPDMPKGTIYAHCSQLPEWYQSNEVPNVAEVITRRDYYRMDWPLVSRKRQYGVYTEEVLAVYAPFTLGIITNVLNG